MMTPFRPASVGRNPWEGMMDLTDTERLLWEENAALRKLVREMEKLLLKCTDHTINNLPGVQAQITEILNRPEVQAILKEGE